MASPLLFQRGLPLAAETPGLRETICPRAQHRHLATPLPPA